MASLPKMFQVWVTKFVSSFCGTNRNLARIHTSQDDRCRCCGAANETTEHITQCLDPGRTQMFTETVTKLTNWMTAKKGYPPLTYAIQVYLRHRGKKRMSTICADFPTLSTFARDHDKLGWNNFIMGRISSSLLAVQQNHLRQVSSPQSITSWACQFTQHVLSIPHQQWLYRNARIHIRLVEGLTSDEHHKIRDTVLKLIQTDPNDLLPQHQPLLNQQDFLQLGRGPSIDRQHWIAQMNSAQAAATYSSSKRPRDDTLTCTNNKRYRL